MLSVSIGYDNLRIFCVYLIRLMDVTTLSGIVFSLFKKLGAKNDTEKRGGKAGPVILFLLFVWHVCGFYLIPEYLLKS